MKDIHINTNKITMLRKLQQSIFTGSSVRFVQNKSYQAKMLKTKT